MTNDCTITFLVDNTPSPDNMNLKCEHGLSIFIEYDGFSLLCDTGASDAFLHNAQMLGIDIARCNALFLSHGHNDHCGGLKYFVQANNNAPIFASTHINDFDYYSDNGSRHDISLDHALFASLSARHHAVKFPGLWLTPCIAAVAINCHSHPKPLGNKRLLACHHGATPTDTDNFSHEIALAIVHNDALTIISPCSHNGMLNIINDCRQFTHIDTVAHFIGGLHLVDRFENDSHITQMAKEILSEYPTLNIFTGHCTGNNSFNHLKSSLNNHLSKFHTGLALHI